MGAVTSISRVVADRARRGFLSATPERMAKTEEPFRSVITTDADGVVIETQFVSASVLERLFSAGVLAGKDGEAQARLDTGEKFYAHWYYGRVFGLGSRDYRIPYAGRSDAFAIMPATIRGEYHRQCWRQADAALGGDRIAVATRSIVIDDNEPAAVGKILTGRSNAQQARAVCIEYLIDGLDRLRAFWA